MSNKDLNIEAVAEKALGDEKLLSELLDGLTAKKETSRYNCFKVLMHISEQRAEILYPKWDYFVELLGGDNTYWKISGLQIIANLTKADTDNRFEGIFDRYYGLLADEGTIVAAYLAANSGKIARAKPYLQSQITDRLLNIDKIYRGKQIDLIKGHVIEGFNQYCEEAEDKNGIIEFVRGQLRSKSPKTRKAAEGFLKRWGAGEPD